MERLGNARIPILVALAVALVGMLGIWLVGAPVEDEACSAIGLNLREGQSSSTDVGFTPPGTYDCQIRGRGEHRTATVFPDFSYLLWLYFSATVGLAVWMGIEPRPRVIAEAMLGLVLIGALVVLAFFSSALSATVGALILAASLLISLGRAGPAPAEPKGV